MGVCDRCGSVTAAGCQCSFLSSQTISRTGSGSAASPDVAEIIFDPNVENLAEETVDGLLVLYNPPRAKVRRTVGQTIPTDTLQAVSYNIVHWDTGDPTPFWDAGDSNRFTVPAGAAGLYVMMYQVEWEESKNAGGDFRFEVIHQPSGDRILRNTHPHIAEVGDALRYGSSVEIELDDGDTLDAYVYHTYGSDVILTADSYAPTWSIRRICAQAA